MKKLYILLLLNLSVLSLFAQQTAMPAYCKNPGGGIQVGGDFTVSPQYACLDYTTNKATIYVSNAISPSGGQFSNLGYIFNFKDGDNIVFLSSVQNSTTVSAPGIYWILQGGNEKGNAYITCKSFEVIQTEQPDFEVTTVANDVTVIFLDTPKNRKHGRYRLVWGDGSEFYSSKISFLPYQIRHNYSLAPSNTPNIIAEYTRGFTDITVCRSEVVSFATNIKPRIVRLESPNNTSNKIVITNGFENKQYIIQQKTNNGAWVDTGKKISRVTGTSSAEQIIDNLNSSNQYCFRLRDIDSLKSELISNEVCSIKLKTTLLSDTGVKLEWNIPDSTNTQNYIITYSEKDGNNLNTIRVISNNPYTFSTLTCNKKYIFNITAQLYSSNERVNIVSQDILVDPSTIVEFPAPDNISTVSVVSETKTLKYNIFEPSGYTKSKYLFYRSINGGSFEKVGEGVNNFYEDKDVDFEKNYYCYAYKYANECGIQSALSTNKPCNIKLSIENTTLKWTPFILDNSTNKVDYIVELLDKEGAYVKLIIRTSETSLEVKSLIDFEQTSDNKTPKFRILGKINYTINLNGTLIPFPFTVYSNIITYSPILSTANESEILNIYPNPSEEIILFNSTLRLKTAEIVDLQGKIVENQAIEENQISVKNLPKGKYILRLYNQEKKLIVNKTIVKM